MKDMLLETEIIINGSAALCLFYFIVFMPCSLKSGHLAFSQQLRNKFIAFNMFNEKRLRWGFDDSCIDESDSSDIRIYYQIDRRMHHKIEFPVT